MYDINSWLIAIPLLAAMGVAMRIGRTVGKRGAKHHNDESKSQVGAAENVFGQLWPLAAAETSEKPGPVSMAFAASLNDMIDALGARDAAIERHVPELVLFLMFATFVLLGAILGYSSGLTAVKADFPVYAMLILILIVVLVFVIIDLDRPRRGMIEVNQAAMIAVSEAMLKP